MRLHQEDDDYTRCRSLSTMRSYLYQFGVRRTPLRREFLLSSPIGHHIGRHMSHRIFLWVPLPYATDPGGRACPDWLDFNIPRRAYRTRRGVSDAGNCCRNGAPVYARDIHWKRRSICATKLYEPAAGA